MLRVGSIVTRSSIPRRVPCHSVRHASLSKEAASTFGQSDTGLGKSNDLQNIEKSSSNYVLNNVVRTGTAYGKTVVDTGAFIVSIDSATSAGTKDREPMDLIARVPPIEVAGRRAICDAIGGHPRVFINLDRKGPSACGYCGLRFIQKEHHH
ncbi:hypothetical protein PROFUN_01964 [Planoprotostelium fungivorum]|uniref:Zinc finger CHCC-type domain-containing protein n=1 Tax=Planoprotostelium fungivorum TaxID=1890364 RepID=A0A2P6NAZ7_9EUKA|nr:hypothetical protein PROFUN_01964 [Planoprotostelium fungivorum]